MNILKNERKHPVVRTRNQNFGLAVLAILVPGSLLAQNPFFTPGNLVVVVEGCGIHAGTCTGVQAGTGTGAGNSSAGGYGDNQAAPLTLFQYVPSGTASVSFVNSLVFPQSGSGANFPVSGEYGSSSEGNLQLSGTGQYLAVVGYGINATTFNTAYPPGFSLDPYGAAPSGALAQSGSLTGQAYTPIARVVALIDANGQINSSSGIYNIFSTNNPRSVYTADGTTAYLSGQGSGSDLTGGVFYTPLGAVNTAPTAITGADASNNTIAQDTRDVQIVNNTLYVSVDSKEGSGNNRSFIGTLGTAGTPPISLANGGNGPAMLNGFGNSGGTGKVTITTGANSNGNGPNAGLQINISPVSFFFASKSVLYVADSGHPKNDSANSSLGNGGLEKWTNSASDGSGTWSLAYTLHQGLNLVANTSASGTTGLYGLAGVVNGGTVNLYATNYTINDLDPTFLYGITDTLAFTTASQASGEMFSQLDKAPPDSNFKGVSFAPIMPLGSVEITTSPSGLTFTSSGTGCAPGTYVTPVVLAWTPNNSCTLSVVTPQNAPGFQYNFSQWEDGTTAATRVVTAPATTATYTASFNSAALPPAALVVTRSLSRANGLVTVQLTISNNGGTPASNVQLASVKVGSVVATPLPQLLGTIGPGQSVQATVTVPASVGNPGTPSSLTVSGTYTGGSFSSSARITLP